MNFNNSAHQHTRYETLSIAGARGQILKQSNEQYVKQQHKEIYKEIADFVHLNSER